MPRPSPTDKLAEIVRAVRAHPKELSAPEIAASTIVRAVAVDSRGRSSASGWRRNVRPVAA